jgi:DNA-binding CsgD family transcriptional regulator
MDAMYDVQCPEDLWFERTFAATRESLPGTDQGWIGIAESRPSSIDPKRGWASHAPILDAAIDFTLQQSADYIQRRHANPVATDWQLLGAAAKDLPHTKWLRANGARDCFCSAASDPDGLLVVLGALAPDRAGKWPSALVEAWEAVAFHLVAAVRVRLAIADGSAKAEAVFRPDGTLLEANGEGVRRREVLRDSVRRLHRSRGRWRDKPEENEARTPSIDARWTLVDQFESDGRHFVVAYAVDGDAAADTRLSPQERRVADFIVAGWSMKRIAYRLGLSAGAIASYVNRACQKLGVRGRVGLVHALRPR